MEKKINKKRTIDENRKTNPKLSHMFVISKLFIMSKDEW